VSLTFKQLLARPARRIALPDYQILDELRGHTPDGDKWQVSGHAQIFRSTGVEIEHALSDLYQNADRAIADGVGGIHGTYPAAYRTFDGITRLRERFGEIPDYRFRLAILRPLYVMHHEERHPTPSEVAEAAEIGLELAPSPAGWEVIVEFGLDVDERIAQPAPVGD